LNTFQYWEYKKTLLEYSEKTPASDNTIFTLRGIRPSVRQKLEEDSKLQLAVAGKRNQPDTPAPPNRVAASLFVPLGWWGVVNTRTLDEIGIMLNIEEGISLEKIVYILGAGFSAPLGLPVMSNFIEKSKDMYFTSDNQFQHFDAIYKLIREVAYLKNFINSDLHNIEEILSILEMGHLVGDNGKEIENYKTFIKDVIQFYTPKIELERQTQQQSNWLTTAFGQNKLINYYAYFILSLLQVKIGQATDQDFRESKYYYSEFSESNNNIDYGIITLNYDLIIENTLNFLNDNYPLRDKRKFEIENTSNNNIENNKLKIAKLHGCILSDIIPPTWNKSSSQSNYVRNAWKLAYEMLVNANQIRIIGYSMPLSDSYIKYLLSIAFKNSMHLKKIDVLTLDSDDTTYLRYQKLFSFPKFQLKNCKFEDFLMRTYETESLHNRVTRSSKKNPIHTYNISEIDMTSSILENAHRQFMNKPM
jgi:hypothetical protein